jgi:hypothetical protein
VREVASFPRTDIDHARRPSAKVVASTGSIPAPAEEGGEDPLEPEKIRARLAFTVAQAGELAARMCAAPPGDERNEGRAEAARPSSGD